ncbi:LacI family DNA-binding transcriptional regulator [Roseibium sediminicola]|uniref:Substrate-binding domain-containing protein n=1 Tax=Roseibium sediminicola TaxID=2933272 RepID=A0ABT0GTW0_9HYPH|nr:substrate-binding domain-containing protein [Roseibium sp. CAU 1639]MCK7612879.1 substrate-binding domain-containing protein [Roseibium sp. CAU 1639]
MSRLRGSVTIDDVARHVGVAKGTVSRVLNNYTDISEGTRKRILKAVQDLGYQPSATARNLKRGRQDTLGIVIPVGHGSGADPFLSEFIDGIARALDELGLDLLVTTAHSRTHMIETLQRLMARRKVDGFIVTRTEVDDPRIAHLLEQGFPFVAHGRTRDPSGYAWFDIDNESAFADGVRHLYSLGHERIGLIGGTLDLNFALQRRNGYRQGLEALGLAHDPELESLQDVGEKGGFAGAKALLSLSEPPTALLCVTDALAIGAVQFCRKFGLKVGSDVTVIGYDGLPVGEYLDPPLTTFSQSAQDAGGRVARMLIDVLDGKDPKSLQALAQATLIRRASDGAPSMTPAALSEALRDRLKQQPHSGSKGV